MDSATGSSGGSPSRSRRDFFKAAGVGAAVVGLDTALPATAAARPGRRASDDKNPVNLFVTTETLVLDTSGRGRVKLTVGNFGPNATTGPISLKVTSPFYVNFALDPLPEHYTFLYENTEPDVPSIIKIAFPDGLAVNERKTVTIPLVQVATLPHVPPAGRATFTTDPENTTDVDTDLAGNNKNFSVTSQDPTGTSTKDKNPVNLIFQTLPAVLRPESATNVHFVVANTDSSKAHQTQADCFFTFTTPYYVNVDVDRLTPDVKMLYVNGDPAVPSIGQVRLPPGLGPLGESHHQVPMRAGVGAPSMPLAGQGIVTPRKPDYETNNSVSHHYYSVLMLA